MGNILSWTTGRIAMLAVVGMLSSLPAFADETICAGSDRDCPCASPQVEELLPRGPSGCHKERITASGELSFGVVRSADYLGKKAWQRQVVGKFGERFQEWSVAACRAVECTPGALAGSKRCTYSAYACAPDVDTQAVAELKRSRGYAGPPDYIDRYRDESRGQRELSQNEILEMQRLLSRAGFRVSMDGQFGDETSTALIQWQRRAGVPDDGLATYRNLEVLRRRIGA